VTRARWAELFGIDLRSLALFRIAIAGLVLVDLVRRVGDFAAFYTEAGVLPVETVRLLAPRLARFSLHVLVGSSEWAVAALFALAAAAGIALALGWHTRIATAVSWVLLVSLHARNPWLSRMGGDTMMRVFLFWAMFLPLGARMSLDARRDPSLRTAPTLHLSAASVALLGQVCLVYFATGLEKSGELWSNGTAVRYALEVDPMVTRFGVWLREHGAALLPLATHGTVWFERLGPLLAFSPVATGPVRTATVALFFVFHLMLAASLDIGLFPFAAMVGWLVFLPGWFWDVLLRRSERPLGTVAPAPFALRWPVEIAVAALFAWVVANVTFTTLHMGDPMPRPVAAVGYVLRLSQLWTMFSPNPPVQDIWVERVGTTRSGERFDVAREAPATPEKPELLSSEASWSWRIWLGQLLGLELDDPMRGPILDRLADVSCRDWNAAHPEAERFESIDIVEVVERTLPVGVAPLQRIVLVHRPCAVFESKGE
jgi:Vitamin K-dependent gamma-carboxylase